MHEHLLPTPAIAKVWREHSRRHEVTSVLSGACDITRQDLGRSCVGLESELNDLQLMARINTRLHTRLFKGSKVREGAPFIFRGVGAFLIFANNTVTDTKYLHDAEYLSGNAIGVITHAVPTVEAVEETRLNRTKVTIPPSLFTPVLLLGDNYCYRKTAQDNDMRMPLKTGAKVIGVPLEYIMPSMVLPGLAEAA